MVDIILWFVSKLPFLMSTQHSQWAEWLQGQPEHSRLSEHISFRLKMV